MSWSGSGSKAKFFLLGIPLASGYGAGNFLCKERGQGRIVVPLGGQNAGAQADEEHVERSKILNCWGDQISILFYANPHARKYQKRMMTMAKDLATVGELTASEVFQNISLALSSHWGECTIAKSLHVNSYRWGLYEHEYWARKWNDTLDGMPLGTFGLVHLTQGAMLVTTTAN